MVDLARETPSDSGGDSAMLAAALVAYGILGSDFSYADVKQALRGHMRKDPLDATLQLVLVGGALFYLAEKDHNDEVNCLWDGVSYVATSLNVGYHYAHPVTAAGKAICTWVQSIGPALVQFTLDAPDAIGDVASDDALEVQKQILAKLDAIHSELATRA